MRELSQRATYLYEEAGRYWFSTQTDLNRAAEDRAKSYADHEVDAAISKVLVEDAGAKGSFYRVFAAPDDPTTIDEATALSLVILGPSAPHSGKGVAKSAATDATTDALTPVSGIPAPLPEYFNLRSRRRGASCGGSRGHAPLDGLGFHRSR